MEFLDDYDNDRCNYEDGEPIMLEARRYVRWFA